MDKSKGTAPLHSLEKKRDRAEHQSAHHRPRNDDLPNLRPRARCAVQQPAADRSARSNDRAAQERRATGALHSRVKIRLSCEHRGVGEPRGVGDGGLEVHVGRHDLARAGRAEFVGAHGGREVEEEEVRRAVGRHVRDEGDLVVALAEVDGRVDGIAGARAAASSETNGGGSGVEAVDAVAAAVVLGADGLLEGDQRVENVVCAEDIGVDG